MAAGMNPMDLKRGIDLAVRVVLEDLTKNTKKISTPQEIAQGETTLVSSVVSDLPHSFRV